MNLLIPLMIVAVVLIWIGFKWNNARTKVAFFFMLFGVLFVLFFGFLLFTGSSFDFSSVGEVTTSLRSYAIWMKNLAASTFQTTGKVIGFVKNSTA